MIEYFNNNKYSGNIQWGIGTNILVNDDISMFIEYTSLTNNMDGTYLSVRGVDVNIITK